MTTPRYSLGDTSYSLSRENDRLILTNNNIQTVRVSSDNNDDTLEVVKNNNPTLSLTTSDTSALSSASLNFRKNTDTWSIVGGLADAGTTNPNFDLHFRKNNTEYITLVDNGYVGFGTTEPLFNLDVKGTQRTQGDLVVSGNIFIDGISGQVVEFGDIWFKDNLDNVFSVLGGNYIIGSTAVGSNKLDVYGNIGANGNVVPLADDVYSLGTISNKFSDLFVGDIDATTLDVQSDVVVGGDIIANGYVEGAQRICEIEMSGLNSTGNQSIPNNTFTPVSLNYIVTSPGPPPIHQKVFEFNNGYPNPSASAGTLIEQYITIPETGYYRLTAKCIFASNATGYRSSQYVINGSTLRNTINVAAVNGANTIFTNTTLVLLVANDTVGVRVLQTSGGNLNLVSGDFYIEYISDTF